MWVRALGKDNVTSEEIEKIQQLLKKEKPTHLQRAP